MSQRPTLLAKVFGCYKITFRKSGNEKTNGRYRATQMNLLVMENLFYDRRFSKVSNRQPTETGFLTPRCPLRYTTSRDPLAIVMYSLLEGRMRYYWTKTWCRVRTASGLLFIDLLKTRCPCISILCARALQTYHARSAVQRQQISGGPQCYGLLSCVWGKPWIPSCQRFTQWTPGR